MKKKHMVVIFAIIILVSGINRLNRYIKEPPQFIMDGFYFYVQNNMPLSESEVSILKAREVGQTEKRVFLKLKKDGDGFKCPPGSKIYLVDLEELFSSTRYARRYSATQGYNLTIIEIKGKHYFAEIYSPDLLRYSYVGMLNYFQEKYY